MPTTLERSPLLALLTHEEGRVRLDELLETIPARGTDEELVLWFVELAEWIRPRRAEKAGLRLAFLETRLDAGLELRAAMTTAVGRLLAALEIDRLLAYGGIALDFHFLGAFGEWLLRHALPAACKTRDGASVLRLAFVEGDLAWLAEPDVIAFFRRFVDEKQASSLRQSLDEALADLGHQLVAQAHAPNVRCLDLALRSPFRGLFSTVSALVASPCDEALFLAVRGRIRQCALLLRSHRTELGLRGVRLNTTFQLRRMHEQLDRLLVLATVCHDPVDATLAVGLTSLVTDVLRGGSGRRLFTRTADLLVRNLVDSAATVGRGYLDDESSRWRAAFLAGAGGGAIMAVATILKYGLAALALPNFYEGIVFSLNYAGGFCAAYLLHFTIATKLPAHTAAALARAVQGEGGHRARLRAFLDAWRGAVRLQVAGLVGNVVVAGPFAWLLDVGLHRLVGRHVVSAEKAEHLLASTSVLGPSIVFAAITGAFLWASSLVGAFGDNWVRVASLADRLATNRRVLKRVGLARARLWADAVVGRFGGLLGNATLGFLLGVVPAAFVIARLPLDIRHVTVSTSSVALALAQGAGSRREVALALAGLVVIGVVNVVVSFVLALWLALRASRGMRPSPSASALLRIGLRRWVSFAPRATRREA